MPLEIRLDDRLSSVELVSKEGSHLRIKVDDKFYELDLIKVEDGLYSVLLGGKSFSVQVLEKDDVKQYSVNTSERSFDLEIIDAETRYLKSLKGNDDGDGENIISSPMPGKVVKIPVKAGQKVENGQTVIIVSAMKMESEYRAGKNGLVKEIHVNEGDTIEGNQPLVTLE